MDYSDYLTPEQLAREEELWRAVGIYRLYADRLMAAMTHPEMSVLEIGCGTGWVPTQLPVTADYTGVDANEHCLEIAKTKSLHPFIQSDIRELSTWPRDIVCGFAFLKHFALHEWAHIVVRFLSFGRYSLFTMNLGTQDSDDFDNGGFPHTWVSHRTLVNAVTDAHHLIVGTELLETGETMVRTERKTC